VRLLDGSYAKVETVARAKDDFTPTPPDPTLALCHYEAERLKLHPVLWEPASGDGRMVRDLERCGHGVFASDLRDRGCGALIKDFFAFDRAPARAIVTNPPFNRCNARDGDCQWMWHALETLAVDYMALLLPWSWPGAFGTAELWAAHPPARVYLMRWKIDFTGGGAPPTYNGWFIWERGFMGDPKFLTMDRRDQRQASLFEREGA
jgi:hypothetical protein